MIFKSLVWSPLDHYVIYLGQEKLHLLQINEINVTLKGLIEGTSLIEDAPNLQP